MAVDATTITVSTTATQITHLERDAVSGLTVAIRVPAGGATVYLGGPNVDTAGNGWPLNAGETFLPTIDPGETIYAVVSTGTQPLKCFWQGV